MLLSTLLTALSSAALTAAQLVPIGFQIQGSNYCMDVRDGVSKIGAVVQIWECHGGPYQRWVVEYPTRVLDPGDLMGESQFSRIRWAGSRVDMEHSGYCLGFKTKGMFASLHSLLEHAGGGHTKRKLRLTLTR